MGTRCNFTAPCDRRSLRGAAVFLRLWAGTFQPRPPCPLQGLSPGQSRPPGLLQDVTKAIGMIDHPRRSGDAFEWSGGQNRLREHCWPLSPETHGHDPKNRYFRRIGV